jgi:hypothetical protein
MGGSCSFSKKNVSDTISIIKGDHNSKTEQEVLIILIL